MVEDKNSNGLGGGGEIPHSAGKAKGQRAMAVAKIYPEPERGRGKKDPAKETEKVSYSRVKVARTVLQYAPDLAANVLTRPPGPAVVPSGCQHPMEAKMAGDPLALEKEMRENAEQIWKCQQKLDEQPSNMGENNPLQDELSRLIEKRKQLKERWEKALTGQSPKQ